MADQLYLSLWFPNFRFAGLPAAVIAVLRQFARISGLPRVAAAAAYPVGFSEVPSYQRIYVLDTRSNEESDSIIETAVAECMEMLHEGHRIRVRDEVAAMDARRRPSGVRPALETQRADGQAARVWA